MSSARDVATHESTTTEEEAEDPTPAVPEGAGRQQINLQGEAETQSETSLEDWTWQQTKAPLGGSIVFGLTVQHQTADVNIGTEMDLIGYFAELQDFDNKDIAIRDTVLLDEDGRFDFTIDIGVPNDEAFLGDQWVYAGIVLPDGSTFLRGHAVEIGPTGNGDGINGNGGNGDTDGDGVELPIVGRVDRSDLIPVLMGAGSGAVAAALRSQR